MNLPKRFVLLSVGLFISACAATPPPRSPWSAEYAERVKPPRSNPKFPLQMPPHPDPAHCETRQGIVGMMIWVDEGGIPKKVIVGKSSGDPGLDEAATGVLGYWRLQPGSIDGVPTAMWGCWATTFEGSKRRYRPTDKDKADHAVFDQMCKDARPVLPARPAPADKPASQPAE